MVAAVKISEALAGKKMLTGRRADMSEAELDGTFATLVETQEGGVFAGSFQGESAWERHTKGDELVQVIDGTTRLTILTEDGPAGTRDVSGHGDRGTAGLLAPLRVRNRRYGHDHDTAADGSLDGRGSARGRLTKSGRQEDRKAASQRRLRRAASPSPARPRPKRAIVAGSGMVATATDCASIPPTYPVPKILVPGPTAKGALGV